MSLNTRMLCAFSITEEKMIVNHIHYHVYVCVSVWHMWGCTHVCV